MTKGHPRSLSFDSTCVIIYKSLKLSPHIWCPLERRKRRFISSHMAHAFPICTKKPETFILGQYIFFYSLVFLFFIVRLLKKLKPVISFELATI